MARDNFTKKQIAEALETNALLTSRKWGADLFGNGPHYECEVCHFVSNARDHFQVDHIHPCAAGGTRNKWTEDQLAEAGAGNIALIYQLGINHMVLCFGCNQAKKARQFVPPGAGWAYRMPYLDLNPDHIYNGAPKVTDRDIAMHPEPFDPDRYR
jgi:5-methylcytosine-specific restriction endonuclease McrA